MNKLKQISKLMSLILRHKPEVIGETLDESGWLAISKLINGVNRKGFQFTEELLQQVVKENDKQRFIISEDGLKIRANQGHSIEVDLKMKAIEPPEFLYHGTVEKFMLPIKEKGLLKMNRQLVHLSADKETATKVASRRGKPIILTIQAAKMHIEGGAFFKSENGVWLTDKVEPEYITE